MSILRNFREIPEGTTEGIRKGTPKEFLEETSGGIQNRLEEAVG